MTTGNPFTSIAVVGFGLIGASICRAVRETAPEVRLVAIDVPSVAKSETARAMVDSVVSALDQDAVAKTLAEAELTVLATPVGIICEILPFVLDHAPLVTDCGSTKRAVVQTADRTGKQDRFVPGHPMAGGPRGGFEGARSDLFRDQNWILCTDFGVSPALEAVEAFVSSLGAAAVRMDSEQHDAAVALTSHVPQLLSSALVTLVAEADATPAAGPSYRNSTRGAGGNLDVWHDIFISNGDRVSDVARELGELLIAVAADLDRGEVDAALRVLEAARALRGTWRQPE